MDSATCQAMASPSRSKSVASHRSVAVLNARLSRTTLSFWSGRISYSGVKSSTVSTPIRPSGRSRTWPLLAVTVKPDPR